MKWVAHYTGLLSLLLLGGILYGALLNRTPVHLNQDEVGLLPKITYFDPKFTNVKKLPVGSLILYSHHNVDSQKQTLGPFRKLSPISEPDGTQKFYLYRN